MNDVRPFYLPGSSALSQVLQRARAALAAWAGEWLDEAQRLASLSVVNADASVAQVSGEFERMQGANGQVWIRRSVHDRANFGLAVLGTGLMPRSRYADEWIGDIAEQAWTMRNRALCEALVGASATASGVSGSPAQLAGTGSGAVQVCCEPLGLHAIADRGVWSLVPPTEREAAPRPALSSLDRAARRARLRIEVLLGSAELELPKVMDLRRGDVLRLSARLDQPLTVSCEGRPFARALLGDAAGRKCIQFTDKYQ